MFAPFRRHHPGRTTFRSVVAAALCFALLAQSGCTAIKGLQRDDYAPFEVNTTTSRQVVGVILLSGETVMFEELVFDWKTRPRPILGATTDTLWVRVEKHVSGPSEVRGIPLDEIDTFLVRLPDADRTFAFALATGLFVGGLVLGYIFLAGAVGGGG